MSSRKAVAAKISNAATGYGTAPGHLGMVIDRNEVRGLVLEIGGTIFPFFPLLGEAWVFCIGVMIAFVMIKALIGWIIRGYILWTEQGWGWWVLGAIWSTAFTLLRTPHELMMAAIANLRAPFVAAEGGEAPRPPAGPPAIVHLTHKELTELIQEEIIAMDQNRSSPAEGDERNKDRLDSEEEEALIFARRKP